MRKFLIVFAIPLLISCDSNEYNKSLGQNVKAKVSKIKTIYSKSGIPGYYIQVGYFSSKPSNVFIDNIKKLSLPYTILEKYVNDKLGYYALIGPYISYNKAKEVLDKSKDKMIKGAFIIKISRP